jgi:hypothetical protein
MMYSGIDLHSNNSVVAVIPALTRKIFRLSCRANQRYKLARLTQQEGRLAIVTNVR